MRTLGTLLPVSTPSVYPLDPGSVYAVTGSHPETAMLPYHPSWSDHFECIEVSAIDLMIPFNGQNLPRKRVELILYPSQLAYPDLAPVR